MVPIGTIPLMSALGVTYEDIFPLIPWYSCNDGENGVILLVDRWHQWFIVESKFVSYYSEFDSREVPIGLYGYYQHIDVSIQE